MDNEDVKTVTNNVAMDELMFQRADRQGNSAWLALQVENQLEARSKALQWMEEHRGSTLDELGSWLRHPVLNPRLLIGAAAGAGTAFIVFLIALQPMAAPYVAEYGVWPAAVAAGVISALAVSWPSLRQYYM